jgi:hypothetical protein
MVSQCTIWLPIAYKNLCLFSTLLVFVSVERQIPLLQCFLIENGNQICVSSCHLCVGITAVAIASCLQVVHNELLTTTDTFVSCRLT